MKSISSQIKDRAVLFLEAKLGSTNPTLAKHVAEGNVIIRDERLYVRKAILVGASGIIEMVESVDSKEIGKTSFSKGKTEETTSIGITGIVARYAPAANSNNVISQRYSEFIYDYAGAPIVPAELLSSEVEIKIGSLKVYEGKLQNLFTNGRESSMPGSGFLELKAPKYVKGGQDVQISVRMPKGVVMPGTATHNHFLEFEFEGAATSIKL